MSLKDLVKSYLEEQSLFRERKNKDRVIVNLLINRYGLHHAIDRGEITKDRIVALVQDYASMDRAWRKTLEENPSLRGKDYDEKYELEIRTMAGLGYNVSNMPREVEAVHQPKQPTLL